MIDTITPKEWCKRNHQWRRIDNIEYAWFMLEKQIKGSIQRQFWLAVLHILGEHT